MEKYVIDFEYAKKLKELGVEQKSAYYYGNEGNEDFIIEGMKMGVSAWTSDEILERLPSYIKHYRLEINKDRLKQTKRELRSFRVSSGFIFI